MKPRLEGTQQPSTPEAQSQVLAQRRLKVLATPSFNVPDKVLLLPSRPVTIGRCAPTTTAQVMMHSPKLPSMLSRKHAAIKYNPKIKHWLVEDLESLNGVYINNTKLASRTPTVLKLGDEVCFGVNIDTNEFKYVLTLDHGRPALKRSSGGDIQPSSQESDDDATPPESPVPRKKHCGSRSEEPEIKPLWEEVVTRIPHTSTPVKKEAVTPTPSQESTTSLRSQLSVENAIFPDEIEKEHRDSLSQLFGDIKPEPTSTLRNLGHDAATIQVQMAKEEMNKEKHKLLSSIEALKSELAAKDQLLAEKDVKEKTEQQKTTTANESMLSSMQEEFTCVICHELFINTYTLPCAHSFCEWCIKEWIKGKSQKDCPICRKKITSEPVHSLALDNAISKIAEKLGPDAQEEREKLKKSYAESLEKFNSRSKVAASRSATGASRSTAATSSGVTGRGIVTRSMAVAPPVIVVPDVPDVRHSVIHIRVPDVRHSPFRGPIVISDDSLLSDDSDGDDSDDAGDSESDDYDSDYDEGMPGAYYGGYGYCYICGRHGHWAPGCPYGY